MNLLPAIDILEGRAVRLAQGDYSKVTVYNDDLVAQARAFADAGATWLHVVDLEGARSGIPAAAGLIEEVIAATNMHVEVGGGIRSLESIARYIDAGAERVVVGTALVRDPGMAREAAAAFGGHVTAGVDARDGIVALEGWREGSGVPAAELVAELADMGIQHLVYTDISRDGMQTGINVDAYARIARESGVGVTVSGGVSTLEDIAAVARAAASLAAEGCAGCIEGVITGRAVYEGAFTVEEALATIA